MSLFGAPDIKKLKIEDNIQGLVKALGYRAFSEQGSWIRYAAAEALGDLKEVGAIESLIAKLGQENEISYVRKAAALALAQLQDIRAIEPLIAALNDKNGFVRQAAAEVLGEFSDVRAVQPLITKLNDEFILVRGAAAKSLGQLKDTRAVEPLINALKDENDYMRIIAASALEKLGIAAVGLPRESRGVPDEALIPMLEGADLQPRYLNMQIPDPFSEEEYVRRCAHVEFTEEQETRTFTSDPAFANVLTPLNARQYKRAIKAGRAILPRFPDFDLIYKWIGSAYRRTQQLSKSRDILSEGIGKAKRKSLLLTDMGETEWQSGNIQEAIYWWCQALHCLSSNPVDYNAYLLLSYVAKEIGILDFEQALIARVNSIKGGQIRLDPMTAGRLSQLVKEKKTEAIRKALKELQAKYF